jgi:hypothetical protein
MDVFEKISAQIASVGLPLYAVTATAVPRVDTPVLLLLHWHGFRRELSLPMTDRRAGLRAVPGSALQLNERWSALESIDAAILDAGWRLGAWDVERAEARPCRHVCANPQEALACRQAFGEHPLDGDKEMHLLAEAPDRAELMRLGAAIGYVRWQFRPTRGGLWGATADDDTLAADGSRPPPCPVLPEALRGGGKAPVSYRLGRSARLVLR